MLVLSRKSGEELVIGNSIRVKILSIKGNRVHLGIEAPPEVSIVREELTTQKQIVPKRVAEKNRNYQGRKMAVVPTATSA